MSKITKMVKNYHFDTVFLNFFRNGFLQRSEFFLRHIQCITTLLLSYLNQHSNIFPAFHPKGGLLWFCGGQKLHRVEKWSEKFTKKIWMIGPNGTGKWVAAVSSSRVVLLGALYTALVSHSTQWSPKTATASASHQIPWLQTTNQPPGSVWVHDQTTSS